MTLWSRKLSKVRGTRAGFLASIAVVPFVFAAFVAGALLPSIDNPLPDSIGLGFPFTMAGAFGVFVGTVLPEGSAEWRDPAIRRAGRLGFLFGGGVYVLSLVNQLTFQL